MTRLQGVPSFDGHPIAPKPIGAPPAVGPVDEVTRLRLRRLLTSYFGEFPTLDRHLGLLDRRGAWYAEAALGAWTAEQPDAFFGLVRHVVRTQIPGPAPVPDLEGWLEAGVPQGDQLLAERWRYVRALRYPVARQPAERARAHTGAALSTTDLVVAGWPEKHWERFVLSYVKLERVLERRSMILPPIHQ